MTSSITDSRAPADPARLVARPAHEASAADWDAYVEAHPEGRFCHLWGFRRVLERVYGYRCAYVDLVSGSERVGIFPAAAIRQGAGRLVSQPFNEYGGPLLSTLDTAQSAAAAERLLEVAREHRCASVEIRGGVGCEPLLASPACTKHPLHTYAVLDLVPPDELWRKHVRHEVRKGVNSAKRAGLECGVRRGANAVADPFYSLYLSSMKRLGVPPHPRRFFEELVAGLGERVVAAWTTNAGATVSVLLGFVTGGRVQIVIIASRDDAWQLRPNDLSHWTLITWAWEQGLPRFDFGPARYEGQTHYKKKWGVTFYEYSYYLIAAPGSAESRKIQTVRTSSKLMDAMATAWRRLVPLGLTPMLGRPIRRILTK